ncbi:hypothetical protein RIF29_39548 [Crotalaria pallida]|uniref:Uncharacterized protein n=1 Tax=Crotalaria pallida TaxID=3830 RepID=A0AAN9E3V4_CROPI
MKSHLRKVLSGEGEILAMMCYAYTLKNPTQAQEVVVMAVALQLTIVTLPKTLNHPALFIYDTTTTTISREVPLLPLFSNRGSTFAIETPPTGEDHRVEALSLCQYESVVTIVAAAEEL